ncbi:hypothetical protein PFISCL1PPCAC_24608, partial [Pristionchus fissidentatus]
FQAAIYQWECTGGSMAGLGYFIYSALMGTVTSPAGVSPLNASWGSVAPSGAAANWMTSLSSLGGPASLVTSTWPVPAGSMKPNTGFRRYSLLLEDLTCKTTLPASELVRVWVMTPPAAGTVPAAGSTARGI